MGRFRAGVSAWIVELKLTMRIPHVGPERLKPVFYTVQDHKFISLRQGYFTNINTGVDTWYIEILSGPRRFRHSMLPQRLSPPPKSCDLSSSGEDPES